MDATTKDTKIPKVKWSASAAITVSLLAYVMSQLFIVIPLLIIKSFAGESGDGADLFNQPWASLSIGSVAAAGLLLTLFAYLKAKKIPIKTLGFRKPSTNVFGLVPLAYVGYIFVLALVMWTVKDLMPSFDSNQLQDVGFVGVQGWQLLLAFVGLVILPPVAEETLFRGFLYQGLRDNKNVLAILIWGTLAAWLAYAIGGAVAALVVLALTALSAVVTTRSSKLGAAIFTSMLFGLVHAQWNVAIDTFILSFALIWVFEKTGSIWASISLHALKNCIAFVGLFLLSG